jgi:hypothetical protein
MELLDNSLDNSNKLATKLIRYSPHLVELDSVEMSIALLELNENEMFVLRRGIATMQNFASGFYG